MSIEDKVRSYVLENFLFTDDQSMLNSSDSFMGKGIIDSTGILEVIDYLAEEFGITVDDDEMIPANLDSVDNIKAYVERKQAG